MKEAIASFLTASAVGVVIGLLKLPVPAPPTLAGVLGVAGIALGYTVAQMI